MSRLAQSDRIFARRVVPKSVRGNLRVQFVSRQPSSVLSWPSYKRVFASRFGGFEDKKKDADFEERVFNGIVPTRKTREVADSIHVAVKAAARQAAGKDEFSCLHVRYAQIPVILSSC